MRQFSSRAKKEMLQQSMSERLEQLAFLSAYARVAGAFGFENSQKQFLLKADKEYIKVVLCDLIEGLFGRELNYEVLEKSLVFRGDFADELLEKLKIFTENTYGEKEYLLQLADEFFASEATVLNVLKAFFIGCGFVSLVKGYHLEFAFSNGFLASDCMELLGGLGIVAKQITRAEKEVVYLKGAEPIGDFLSVLGATEAVLKLMDVLVEREATRLINRRMNCDMANIDKTIALAGKQISVIEDLKASGKYESLNDKLKEVASARLENPEASLDELAEIIGISKSGLRHRLDKIMNR
ncbi:MAG: DNA-binding protein WhiA [Firmicutes bacterium]|nr:DNA-binding protein WhiA [Bacillota bacterium]